MRYINPSNPNITILIKRGPDLPKGENQNTRQDKFVEFRFGLAETEDPDAIDFLDGPKGKARGCIRESDADKVKGYVKEADMEQAVEAEVKRRMAEITLQGHEGTRRDTSSVPGLEGGPFECVVCQKRFPIGLALSGHMKTHRKEMARGKELAHA